MPESTIGGWSWVIASYALTWATLGIYTGWVMRRRVRAERAHAAPAAGEGAGR